MGARGAPASAPGQRLATAILLKVLYFDIMNIALKIAPPHPPSTIKCPPVDNQFTSNYLEVAAVSCL